MSSKLIMLCGIIGIMTLIACGNEDNEQSVEVNTAREIDQKKKETPDIADASFKDGMTGKAFHNYLQLKMALVNDDSKGAQTAAGNLAEGFSEERIEIKNSATQIAQSDDLANQRLHFYTLSQRLMPLFKENLSEGTIYKQYCPMAFDNQGAFWLSDVNEIRNPYFGDQMLTCGKVEEEISK